MPSIDAKLARRDPASWQALSATTSIVPFVAITQRRNRFVPREIGWLTVLIAVVTRDALNTAWRAATGSSGTGRDPKRRSISFLTQATHSTNPASSIA
jgi:hypothetical protein